jgi:alpha-tubulin suppressor-like RCC1 family protein
MYKEDNTVFHTGDNSHKQAGTTAHPNNDSFQVITVLDKYKSRIKKISAGGWHCHCLLTDGTLLGWGYNTDGRAGLKQFRDLDVPMIVNIPMNSSIIDVSDGGWSTVVLTGTHNNIY